MIFHMITTPVGFGSILFYFEDHVYCNQMTATTFGITQLDFSFVSKLL